MKKDIEKAVNNLENSLKIYLERIEANSKYFNKSKRIEEVEQKFLEILRKKQKKISKFKDKPKKLSKHIDLDLLLKEDK